MSTQPRTLTGPQPCGEAPQRGCLACGRRDGALVVERLIECSVMRCASCGLQYAAPVPAASPLFVDFSESGAALISRLSEGERVGPLLTPNERMALRWLRRRLPGGAQVLELCCESGRFLAALREGGLRPFGMDPLESHVAVLKRGGFAVAQGDERDCPEDWPSPAAVVLLESLVRLPDPVGVLKGIRERFPQAPLLVSVPSPRRSLKVPEFDRRLDYPPHHLTRWTPRALTAAMAAAGYRCSPRMTHVDLKCWKGPARRRVVRLLLAVFLRLVGESEYSIVALGRPDEGACPGAAEGRCGS